MKAFVQQLQRKVTDCGHREDGDGVSEHTVTNTNLPQPISQVPHELKVLEAALDNVRL